MPATYEPIATTTLGSAASSITFSSIGSGYTDLRLIIVGAQATTSSAYLSYQFNSDTGNNYSGKILSGDGAAVTSSYLTSYSAGLISNNTISQTISMAILDIFSYAGSTNKTSLATWASDRNGSGYSQRIISLWRSTSAITSVKILSDATGNFATGTTAALYGILKA